MLHLNPQSITPAVKSLMIACTGVYLIQRLMPDPTTLAFMKLFGLGVEGMMNGFVWQLATYTFLHGNLLHLLLNMLGLFFLGPELERRLGVRMFLALFMFSAILGGLGWLALTWPYEGICVGASGGVFGLIGAFAGLFPHRQLTLLVFFVLPVTMPAWLMAVLFGLLQLAYLLNPGGTGIAYAAHLAGGLAGYVFVRMMYRTPGPRTNFSIRPTAPSAPTEAEIDRILDKISQEGLHRLTPREREMLHRAGRRRD